MREFMNTLAQYTGILSACFVFLGAAAAAAAVLRYAKEQKKKKEEQTKAANCLYSIFSHNPFQMYILLQGADLAPVFVSENTEEILGVGKEDMSLDIFSLSRCMEEEDYQKTEEAVKRSKWEGKTELDVPYVHGKTGKKGFLLLRMIYWEAEDIYGIFIEDISGWKEKERQLKEKLRLEKTESTTKTEVLSRMSHEIRTPLNGILGLLELTKEEAPKEGILKENLEKMQDLSHFLLNLMNDILDLTRIESGKIILEQEPFDLVEMAEKLRSMFQKTAGQKGIYFELRTEGFENNWVIGDEMRLSQIIINFLSNAIKFTEPGGSVWLTFRQMHKIDRRLRLMIQVRDTGKGMEPEFLNRIFRPFEQENNEIAKKYGGSGLGMSIADTLIQMMGGEIVVDSEVGKGSDFTLFLSLPVAKAEKEQKIVSQEDPFQYLEGANILLAEDNDINARIIIAMLEKEGATVKRALTGKEAVMEFENSREDSYDAILMDIQMPEMNGWEAAGRIRGMNRADALTIPIYALSANAYTEDRRRSAQAGMNGHISKPVNFDILKETVGRAIRDREKTKDCMIRKEPRRK